MSLVHLFNRQWNEVPIVVLDTETTGRDPGYDRAVSVGFARFEGRRLVATLSAFVDPGIPIPTEATEIHGITDAMVAGAPPAVDLFAESRVREILDGAQPCGYNAKFDRQFVPPIGDWDWPWLDVLSIVRVVDKFVPGKGRHKLEATCARHGIVLTKAHDAGADAQACGELLFKIGKTAIASGRTLGALLGKQLAAEAASWVDHWQWRANQPPIELDEGSDVRPAFDRDARDPNS